jgi:hypothetical protein
MVCILTFLTFREYSGQSAIYIFFTVVLNFFLFFGFRKNRIFFDTFLGIFFWLGYWLKFSFRIAFTWGYFVDPVGNFDKSGISFDHALLVTTFGVLAFIASSIVRQRWWFSYSCEKSGKGLIGLLEFYKNHRKAIWLNFLLLVIFISGSNAFLGIYQRGTVPRTILPMGLGGVYTWLLLFGLSSASALMLEFEMRLKKGNSFVVVALSIVESFFSNVSLLSRAMVINLSAMGWGYIKALEVKKMAVSWKFKSAATVLFLALFLSSVSFVNKLRHFRFRDKVVATQISKSIKPIKVIEPAQTNFKENIKSAVHNLKIFNIHSNLIIDRWVGIEGVMAVISYPKRGWDLWAKAWEEKYHNFGTSFYDREISKPPHLSADLSNLHKIFLPGILAFFYYPGSFLFLFFGLFIVGLLGAGVEFFAFKLSNGNLILTSLISQVVTYRFTHFGYVPARSYLLFGTIFLNIVIIYIANKLLLKFYRLDESSRELPSKLIKV